jgi:hypothetical protein
MNLAEAHVEVREDTQHVDDERVSEDAITNAIDRGYKKVRRKLALDVPTLYLAQSADIVLTTAEDIALSSDDYNVGNLHRLDRYETYSQQWVPVERAADYNYNVSRHRRISFRVQNFCIILGPDGWDTSGTYRVIYHPVPGKVTDMDGVFALPPELLPVMIKYACGDVAIKDRDGHELKAKFDSDALAEYKDVLPALKARHGVHADNAGLLRLRW